MAFDVAQVRALYPALANGSAFLDGAAGTQVPRAVIDAISDAYKRGIGNSGGVFRASERSGEITAAARAAVADLVGGVPSGVVLGPNMTTLTYRFAQTLGQTWAAGDEVVVSRLDHDANVRPWVQAAERAGARVVWAEIDPATGELPAEQYARLLSDRTRLVAVTAASNILGTRPDVPAITAAAHAAGALVYVDGVHATPHGPVDIAALGADFYATSAYKWSGPHIGAVIAAPARLEELRPEKLLPAPDDVPSRFETGTPPYADLAGVAAAVDHLAGLDPEAAGDRRARIVASMTAVRTYEETLFADLWRRLTALPGVTAYGPGYGRTAYDGGAARTATAYFTLAGRTPRQVTEHLAARKINAWDGHNYAWETTGVLGLRDSGGAVRVGLAHYNDRREVDRLITALTELTGP
ncbi:MAG TPA: cysteine desulfurase-like protein [Streptosporangiaceae bacterium]|jgi:cysteine desulfurase family protein (TIGR01976 family)